MPLKEDFASGTAINQIRKKLPPHGWTYDGSHYCLRKKLVSRHSPQQLELKDLPLRPLHLIG